MAVSRSDLKAGQKIRVEAFEAKVSDSESLDGCVKIEDASGTFHYVFENQLSLVLPFEDGKPYLSAKGSVYTFRLSSGDGSPYWTYGPDEQEREFDAPARPMSEVTVGTGEYSD